MADQVPVCRLCQVSAVEIGKAAFEQLMQRYMGEVERTDQLTNVAVNREDNSD
jgi:hypothetical protein